MPASLSRLDGETHLDVRGNRKRYRVHVLQEAAVVGVCCYAEFARQGGRVPPLRPQIASKVTAGS